MVHVLNVNISVIHFVFVKSKIWRYYLLLDFSLTVKAATLIFISGSGSAISSAKEGGSCFIYNLVIWRRKRACIS